MSVNVIVTQFVILMIFEYLSTEYELRHKMLANVY